MGTRADGEAAGQIFRARAAPRHISLYSDIMKPPRDAADRVWRALADTARRRLLERLANGLRTTGDLGGEDSACAVPHASLGSAQGYGSVA